jgi:ABC-type glycerol-3-phosphate transport system substrate-binding protein
MRDFRWLWLASATALLLGIAIALLSGCNFPPSQSTAIPDIATDTPAPSEPTAIPTDAPPSAPSVITLTIWTTEAFSPTQAITSGQVLSQEAAAFEAAQPDVRLRFVLKKPYGKGGILDYLLTTQDVVPGLLPDLVVMDVDELPIAVQEELVQPLDDLLPNSLVADLYPFARDACTFDGRLYGLQFQADLDHLAYDTGRLTIPPSSWPGVLSNPGPYIFPAGGQAGLVNDDFLIQYLAVRPWPSEDSPNDPFLDADSLTAVLQYYQDGASRGIFPAAILDYHTTDDCWRDYLAGQAALTHVSAHRYLTDRGRLQSSAAAPIPAISGPAAAINRGWVLALITGDPVRQSAAVEFVTLLMAPEANATWNRVTNYLPTRQAALAYWDEGDGYTPFVHQQLQAARPRPPIPNYTRTAAALQQAVEDVLTGAATPEEAAEQAVESAQ